MPQHTRWGLLFALVVIVWIVSESGFLRNNNVRVVGSAAPVVAEPTHQLQRVPPVTEALNAAVEIDDAPPAEKKVPSVVGVTKRSKVTGDESYSSLVKQKPMEICDEERSSAKGSASSAWVPQCPAQLPTQRDNSDTEIDRQSEWVEKKYQYYATRCNKTKGMMWKQLSRASHDKIASRVMKLMRMDQSGDRVRVFDWASGCGVSLHYLKDTLGSRFSGLGLDLIPAAVRYANESFGDPNLLFCAGDGTQLGWIPDETFDAVTSFGGLLHLPGSLMCSTIRHLVRITRTGGMVWAGYIDNTETATMLMKCRVSCSSDARVHVLSLDENQWLRGVGVPRANRKRKPQSIVWIKGGQSEIARFL